MPSEVEDIIGSLVCVQQYLIEADFDDAAKAVKAAAYIIETQAAELAAIRSKDREDGAREMREPSPGLLMSMAIRYDHALGMAGRYDWLKFPGVGEREPGRHARILASTMGTMRQIWEEVTGSGFYSPAREAAYIASAKACGVELDENGRPVALPLITRTGDGNA